MHPAWAQRSFGAIRHRLGGFEENELRRILVQAGAVRFAAAGNEYWGLIEPQPGRSRAQEFPMPATRTRTSDACSLPGSPHHFSLPRADRRRRRPRLAPLSGILRGQHPQPAHAPGLRPRCGGVSGLVRRTGRAVGRGRAAASRRGLDRAADARASRPRPPSRGWRRCAICSTGW